MSDEQWSDERVFQAFTAQVKAKFERENEAHRKQDAIDIEEIVAKGHPRESWMEVRDSFLWDVFITCEMSYHFNVAVIVLPTGAAHTTQIVDMFDDTSVAWDHPRITAVDGNVVLEVLLIDYWNDERELEWHAKRKEQSCSTSG